MKSIKINSRKNVRGQGMSEYLIIVALVAVAGIAVMGLFGGAATNQVSGLANALGGGTAKAGKDAAALNATAADAIVVGAAGTNLNTYNDDIKTQ